MKKLMILASAFLLVFGVVGTVVLSDLGLRRMILIHWVSHMSYD